MRHSRDVRTSRLVGRSLAVGYLALDVALIIAAFDFAGSVRMPWLGYLLIITLPGSILAWLNLWALFHGANLGCFAVFFLACGVMNVFLAKRLIRRFTSRRSSTSISEESR